MTIQFQTALLPTLLADQEVAKADVAVVIDTLRFTTTAARALASGARQLQAVGDIDEARKLSAEPGSHPTLLCGERECKPIDGFHLGNSPSEYTVDTVQGCELIFTTTNGTRAVQKAQQCQSVLLAALTNRAAVCQRLASQNQARRVVIICSGTNSKVTVEDIIAAGAIIAGASTLGPIEHLDDGSLLAHNAWRQLLENPPITRASESVQPKEELQPDFQETLRGALACSAGGKNLIRFGYESDLKLASELDSCPVVPSSNSVPNRFTASPT